MPCIFQGDRILQTSKLPVINEINTQVQPGSSGAHPCPEQWAEIAEKMWRKGQESGEPVVT